MRNVILFYALIILTPLLSTAQEDSCACCTESHQAFDFWVGEWEVTNPDNQMVGTNSIEKIQNNCVIRENWKATNGVYTGTSYNFYNRSTQQWEQLWIDSNGGNLYLKGNRDGNQMILRSADLTNTEGQAYYHRITWTKNEDGTVRQLWETVTNGENVKIAFDGLYKRNQ